jgi:hypothetical protein
MKDFVPYPEALALKELAFDKKLAFDEPLGYYIELTNPQEGILTIGKLENFNGIIAPTYSQAFRFFREKYDYDVSIKKRTPSTYKFEIEQLFVEDINYYFTDFPFKTYPEAELACLKKLIEIVKRNK